MRALSWASGSCCVLLFGKLLATLAFVNILQRPKATDAPTNTRRTISMTASKTQKMYSTKGEDAMLPFRHSCTVFIEMTDMYGIVFHGNYITYVRRAMEGTFGAAAPRVHSLHDMKFRAAATLGEEAVVEGSLVSCDPARERSRWRFQITSSDPSRLFVSGEATLSWPASADGAEESLPPGHFEPPSAAMTRDGEARQGRDDETKPAQPLPEAFANTPETLEVTVWSDDLERSDSDGVGELTIRAVLNYFERIRTLCVGREPDGELRLMRLHREGFSIVVTNISDLRIHSRGVVAGEKLEVRLGAKLTRGGKILNVYETLWRGDETLIAHAEIVLLCMDNETRKFRPMPSWVQDLIKVSFATRAD